MKYVSIYLQRHFGKSFKTQFGFLGEKGWRYMHLFPGFYNIIISYNAMVLVVERFYVQYLVESLPKNPYILQLKGEYCEEGRCYNLTLNRIYIWI